MRDWIRRPEQSKMKRAYHMRATPQVMRSPDVRSGSRRLTGLGNAPVFTFPILLPLVEDSLIFTKVLTIYQK